MVKYLHLFQDRLDVLGDLVLCDACRDAPRVAGDVDLPLLIVEQRDLVSSSVQASNEILVPEACTEEDVEGCIGHRSLTVDSAAWFEVNRV